MSTQSKSKISQIPVIIFYPIIGFVIAFFAFTWFVIKYIFTPHPNPPY